MYKILKESQHCDKMRSLVSLQSGLSGGTKTTGIDNMIWGTLMLYLTLLSSSDLVISNFYR